MRSRFAFADRASSLGAEVQSRWIGPLEAERSRLSLRIVALSTGAPAGADRMPEAERQVLERLAGASRLPAAERRQLFTLVYDDARAFADASNRLRDLHAEAFAQRLDDLALEVGADPRMPGSADPARAADPGYCWDVVLHDKLASAAGQLRAIGPVSAPQFEFIEGPKATRAAFFGLVEWLARLAGLTTRETPGFVFDEKALLALFASLAVDLGIVFLALSTAPRKPPGFRPRRGKAIAGEDGAPRPPVLHSFFD